MRPFLVPSLLLWAALCWGSTARAEGARRLTVAQAQGLARGHSHLLAGRAEELSAAAHRERSAWARLFPRLSLQLRYTRLSRVEPAELTLPLQLPNQPEPPTLQLGEAVENQYASSLALEQPLFTGLALLHQKAAAAHAVEAAQARLLAEEQELALRTEEAYFGLLRARELLAVAERSQQVLAAHLAQLERLSSAGAATGLDVARTKARLAAARVQRLSAEAAAGSAQLAFNALLGLAPDEAVELAEGPTELPLPEGELLERAGQRPDVAAARAGARAKRSSASAAAGALWPQLAFRAQAQYDQPNPRYFPPKNEPNPSWDASVVLSWAMWDFGAVWHQQRAAAAEAAAAQHAVAQLEEAARLEVGRRGLEARTAAERVGAAAEAVAAARQALRRAQNMCEAGQAACLGVLDAEAELTRLEAEQIQARIDARLSRTQLAKAAGVLALP